MSDLSPFAESIFRRTYAFHERETWEECAARVAKAIAFNPDQEKNFFEVIRDRVFMPGGRYLYTSGREILQCSNCFGFVAGDSRESWAKLLNDVVMCLSMGGGLGVNYSYVRPKGSPIKRMGGEASGPLSLAKMVNECARHVMAGGKRRSALWAGLSWNHLDVKDFISVKDWSEDVRRMKSIDYEYPASLDMTNVSVIIDDTYLSDLRYGNGPVVRLHEDICERMLRTGEPAFANLSSCLKEDSKAYTRNACTESTLHNNDSCNLGSIVFPRIRDLNRLEEVTRIAIQFLYNGSLLGIYPTQDIANVVGRNRRIGLGLIGLHEFALMRGHRYEWFPELEQYMATWSGVSKDEGIKYSNSLGKPNPIAVNAVAPTGTISIIAESTGGIEPVYCKAYKRRYIDGDKHKFQYVIDPTVKRLLSLGVDSKQIEDAYALSYNIKRRLEVNAKVQEYTDQAISSTINLLEYGTPGSVSVKEFSSLMEEYLPRLKGLTTYPNNARSGQPLSPVSIEEAIENVGVVYEETGDTCKNGVCGL